jgi:ATP-dependent Clp endopeptidase proteolytic subunit ClpP
MKYYKSIERREIHLPSDLTMEFVPFFISTVNEMISISSKDITIYCSSYGGDLYAAFSIIDYINLIDAKVNTICIGASMSAASIILGSGTGERTMSKNSTLMIHSAVFEEGKTSYVVKSSEHLKELKINILEVLSKISNKDKDYWKTKIKEDLYLNSEECLDLNLIDKII